MTDHQFSGRLAAVAASADIPMTTIVRGDIRPLDFDPEFDDESDSVALLSSIDGQGRPLLGAPEKRSQGIRSSDSQEPAPLGVAHAEKRFWFQRGAEYDADAIATLVSAPGICWLDVAHL